MCNVHMSVLDFLSEKLRYMEVNETKLESKNKLVHYYQEGGKFSKTNYCYS